MKYLIDESVVGNCGVYRIRNTTNGKFYIGSAFYLRGRYRSHLSLLRNGKHANSYLQRAFCKYGMDAFVFELVEPGNPDAIREREQYWISTSTDIYNLNPTVCPVSLNLRHVCSIVIIGPDDVEYSLKGTKRDIARQLHMIDPTITESSFYQNIIRVFSGKSLHFRGWRLGDNKDLNWKERITRDTSDWGKGWDVVLVGPDGRKHGPIKNLGKFCKEQGIDEPSTIYNLVAGRTRYVNGWYLDDGSGVTPLEKNAKVFEGTLISPEGTEYTPIRNVSKFAVEHKLNQSQLQKLLNGKNKHNNHKGWRVK